MATISHAMNMTNPINKSFNQEQIGQLMHNSVGSNNNIQTYNTKNNRQSDKRNINRTLHYKFSTIQPID